MITALCIDFSDDNPIAGEPYIERHGRLFCPKCLTEIHGLAFGGMGTYWTCETGECDWFYKVMDPKEEM